MFSAFQIMVKINFWLIKIISIFVFLQIEKDTDDSTKLLDQLWTITDFKKGVLTNVKEKHLEDVFNLFKQLNADKKANPSASLFKSLKNVI